MRHVIKEAGRTAYRGWMMFAHALGYVNTKLLLTIFYIIVIGPLWLISALVRHDPLGRRGRASSFWRPRTPVEHTTEAARHQF